MKTLKQRLTSLALAGVMTVGAHGAAYAANDAPATIEEIGQTEIEYIVKKGDYLGKIAEAYFNDSGYWELLAKYNNLENPNDLQPGQIILIPVNPNKTIRYDVENTEYEPDKIYTVKKGDTLYCIVRVQYGLKNQETVDKLATYNGMDNPNTLKVGQEIYIPTIKKLNKVVAKDYTWAYNAIIYQPKDNVIIIPCAPAPCPPAPAPCPPAPAPAPCPPAPGPEAPCNGPVRILKP